MNAAHIPMCRKRLAAGLAGLVVLVGSAVSQQSFAQSIDYDTDDDNLIEVDSLAKLNAIRYDLDGDGTASNTNYATAFPNPETSMGCPATCEGYELMADLDFDTNGDGEITATDGVLSWGNGSGWEPIGTEANRFTAEFHGNGHTISHLFINRTGTVNVGLFGFAGNGACCAGFIDFLTVEEQIQMLAHPCFFMERKCSSPEPAHALDAQGFRRYGMHPSCFFTIDNDASSIAHAHAQNASAHARGTLVLARPGGKSSSCLTY